MRMGYKLNEIYIKYEMCFKQDFLVDEFLKSINLFDKFDR